ncbi:McrB family protein [Brevundimonas sp. TWP2-3-4b1]|uniref:McrB family protein n=1 Tax=Brevundimonas sp. TWP2-3-4b1 TaxID=2804580 RepID=UPI003CEC9D0A
MNPIPETFDRSPAGLAAEAQRLLAAGELIPEPRLETYYATFQEQFGPARLAKLDGSELLERMHAHGTVDSLVYWLEFKNDEEFPSSFGSIAGGSALKFGIFRSKETGLWTTGASRSMRPISEAEAIDVARRNRDQLLAGTRVLDTFSLPDSGDEAIDDAYRELQEEIMRAAPDVFDSAWGHKYFHLYAPAKLDDYHSGDFQRFQLIRLLQEPPKSNGRYVCAGRFVQLARAANLPINHLTTVLNRVNGRPYRYWRIGTNVDGRDIWPDMREGGYAAVGWAAMPDLSNLKHTTADKAKLAGMLLESEANPGSATRKAGELLDFVADIKKGDLVITADGERILGIGRVAGEYEHRRDRLADAPHQRQVDWLDVGGWKLSGSEGLRTTVWEFAKPESKLAFERRFQAASALGPMLVPATRSERASLPPLEPRIKEIAAILQRKGQLILHGPPGTGKTYWARRAALELAAREVFGRPAEGLAPDQLASLDEQDGLVRMVTFHPGFGYEDFIEGYRPQAEGGQLSFQLQDGVFKEFCDKARSDGRPHFLIIDEINRGQIPRIFGELITLLERDKRGIEVRLPSKRRFSVPENLRVIGTMNTADKSIALLDVALRRRFGFVELLPDVSLLSETMIAERLPLAAWLEALNAKIRSTLGRDARSLQIGHAFFLEGGAPVSDPATFAAILAGEVVPLLQEYCYEDYSMLGGLVGGLVDAGLQRIKGELFEPDRADELLTAILNTFPELTASPEALALDLGVAEPEHEDEPEI